MIGCSSYSAARFECRCGNQEIYRRLRLVPRVMRDVSNVQMATTMLGHATAFPVYISGVETLATYQAAGPIMSKHCHA